jgi:hypothetical protein
LKKRKSKKSGKKLIDFTDNKGFRNVGVNGTQRRKQHR